VMLDGLARTELGLARTELSRALVASVNCTRAPVMWTPCELLTWDNHWLELKIKALVFIGFRSSIFSTNIRGTSLAQHSKLDILQKSVGFSNRYYSCMSSAYWW